MPENANPYVGWFQSKNKTKMSSIRDLLKKLFTQNVVVKQLPGGRLKTYDVNKSQSQGNSQTYSPRYKWSSGKNIRTVSGYGSNFTNYEIEAMRRQFYIDYDLMDAESTASAALDIYADESTTLDPHGQLIVIKTDDDRIKKILHNLFYDVLNIEFNLWSWIRMMCKYGDCFLYMQINEEYGVVNVVPIHPSLIERIEGTDENPDIVQFKYEGIGGLHSSLTKFEAFEIAHFRLITDTNFLPYGRSILEPGKRDWKALKLAEDAMLLHRIMRAPERRIVKIDIGNIAPEEVDAYVEQIATEMKKTPYIDPQTGEYDLRYNLNNSMEDYFLPVRGGQSNTSIETLPGLANDGQKEDVDHFKEKFMASVKIPKEYFGYSEGETRSSVTQNDIRFARTIERVQKIFVSEFYKMALVHLKVQGFSTDDLMNFELYLSNPSLVFERQKTDVLTAKVDLAKSIREDNLLSDKYIYENIFGFSTDEWKGMRESVIEDAKHKLRLQQILDEGNDPAVTGRTYGTAHDIATMQVSSKYNLDAETGEEIKKLYTPDERENNAGKPPQYKSSFETRRDQDFGRDPLGRKDLNKMESFLKSLDGLKTRKNIKIIINEDNTKHIEMLDEKLILGDDI